MNRLSVSIWLEDRPLAVQLWIKLSLYLFICTLLVLISVYFFIPGIVIKSQAVLPLIVLFLIICILNIFVAKLALENVVDPMERLSLNLDRIKNKNWTEPILQVSRKDEIGKLINTLSVVQRNVTDINEEEEFFYQSVSHGLKTPIMVIRNCCAAYNDGIYTDEAIEIIQKESRSLELAIRKLLYVTSLDHMLGKNSEFVPIDLRELLLECSQRFVSNERHIHVQNDATTEITICGNRESLQTVFDNILENALRYATSFVVIETLKTEKEVLITISNDGDAISEKTLSMLFEKFYRGVYGHFGLGLFIAKKIVTFHGGDIWAENTRQGVRFSVSLKQK